MPNLLGNIFSGSKYFLVDEGRFDEKKLLLDGWGFWCILICKEDSSGSSVVLIEAICVISL